MDVGLKKKWDAGRFVQQHGILLSIVTVSFGIRILGLPGRDLWYDECLDILQAEKGLAQILRDVSSPLHYIIIHLVMTAIGREPLILMYPSVLSGVATVYVVYRMGLRVWGRDLGLVTAALFAVSPMHINYHNRYFTTHTISLLSKHEFPVLIDILASRKEGIKWHGKLILYCIFSVLSIFSHPTAFLATAIGAIYLGVTLSKTSGLFKATTQNASLLILLLALLISSLLLVGGGYNLQLAKGVRFEVDPSIHVGYSLSKQLGSEVVKLNARFVKGVFAWLGQGGGYRLALYGLFGIAGVAYGIARGQRRIVLLLVAILVFPFVFLFIVNINHWFEEKYFSFMLPPYVLLIAWGVLGRIGAREGGSWLRDRMHGGSGEGNHWPEQKCVGPMRSELWHTCGHFDDNCIPRLGADISRKVYGFPVTQEQEYRWRDVAEYLRRHLEMVIVYLFREVRAYSLMYGLRNAEGQDMV